MTCVTRFAPSPTGPLHLGHAFSAFIAHDMARASGGRFLLRIEDIDTTRSRPQWDTQILDDLAWLGLTWDGPVMRQTDRLDAYRAALDTLWQQGLLYPCTCTRRDIATALSAPQEGADPPMGPDGVIYPGTCRDLSPRTGPIPTEAALRLDLGAALHHPRYTFTETGTPANGTPRTMTRSADVLLSQVGDIVLSRKDFLGSYHLSVILDDAAQQITHVTRGEDLFDATWIHVVLQVLLSLPTPTYHHHRLVRDETGKRLAKRDDARSLATYRSEGRTPDDIRHLAGLAPSSL
ncbi:tRNA glutamyl-Q(34) synthetase GluQRS [Pseudaestuariivita atlantica]|uniref:Glutamyl-tRNA synthetase n=1 Tax=Pseudaestuariivita atlantica TaxID=1317121 RepID=A0A0L1JVX6_9RHOB|nr:tRNA glutamyl-Q(34) synthetase GluQRS [Pseudaestuariivita atlantica]KNG95538.1 glutamyl-tRNA synthetase [Pseudaestuariivita atlantica]